MAQSPQHPDQSRAPYAALPAHNRGDGDHVVRVGGMAHAQEKSQRDNREQSDHLVTRIAASAARYTGRSAAGAILTAVLLPGETKRGEWISNFCWETNRRAVSGAQILWKKGFTAKPGRPSPMQAIPVSEFITKLRASQAHDAKLIFSYAPCTLDVSAEICKLRFSTMATQANPLEERLQDFQFPQREAAFFYGLFLRGHSADELRKDIQVPAAVLAKWDKETVREPQLRPILETIVRYRQHVLAIFENLICHDAATQKLQ